MKHARFDPIFWLLSAAQVVAAPVLLLKKWRRLRARGDAYEWDLKRWNCDFDPEETSTPHLILVAMGFAETRLAAQLTTLLQREVPALKITWAIRNLDAAREGGAIPTGQSVAPFPFDFCIAARNWRQKVRPDAVVFIERFAFPILARELHNHGVRVGAVAARTRGGESGFYRRWLWGAFDVMALRSQAELEKFGAPPPSMQLVVTGSLKFWPQLPAMEIKQRERLEAWLGDDDNRPLLAAGSTQAGDETWILEAFAPLREKYGARLLIAPRHTSRAGEVEALCAARGWNVSRRSQKMKENSNQKRDDVLLLDTIGELTHAYGASCAAFVGGTISGTGHNVLEPIAHGIPVFFGPKRGTFAAEQEMCEAAGVGFRVQTPEELSQGWEKALTQAAWRQEISHKASLLNQQGKRAWETTIEALQQLLAELD